MCETCLLVGRLQYTHLLQYTKLGKSHDTSSMVHYRHSSHALFRYKTALLQYFRHVECKVLQQKGLEFSSKKSPNFLAQKFF